MRFTEIRLDETIIQRDKNSIDHRSRRYYNFKIIMLCQISVGKTSLLRRFIDDEFTKVYNMSRI